MASMTDAEKHAWCKKRTGFCATFVSPVLYAAAEQAGYDMRWYVVTKPMPTLPGNHGRYVVEHKMRSSAEMRAATQAQLAAGLPLGAEHVRTDEEKTAYRAEFEKIIAAGHYSMVAYDYHGTPYARRPKCVKEVCGGKDARCLAGRNGKCVACDNVE